MTKKLSQLLQLGTVDVGNDTIFTEKLPMSGERLTLVIGSGGMGASVIGEALLKARQKLTPDFITYMKFIVVDADVKELSHIEHRYGENAVRTLNISSPGAPGRFMWERRADFYRTFMPKYADVLELDAYGSGKIRMNGKAKFYDKAIDGEYHDTKFRNIILNIYDTEWNAMTGRPVDIMVLAGLSGGTGGGVFEELAAHARYACERAGAVDIRVFGYLFLPDTMEELLGIGNPVFLEPCYANGYAALKELENYMSMSFNRDRKEFFAAHDADIFIGNGKKLFDYPTLISGTYSEATSMTADFIIHFAAGDAFCQRLLFSNSELKRAMYLSNGDNLEAGLLKQDFFPEDSHSYSAIGYACASVPNEIMTANIIGNVCRKLYEDPDAVAFPAAPCFCTEERRMSESEMETEIRKLFFLSDREAVTVKSLWEQKIRPSLKKAGVLPDNAVELTYQDIISGRIEIYRKGFREEECIMHGKNLMKEVLEEVFTRFQAASGGVMCAYGPRAMEFLYFGRGPLDENGYPQFYENVSIQSMLEHVRRELNIIARMNIIEPPYEVERGIRGMLGFFSNYSVNTWKGEFREAVHWRVIREIVRWILEEGVWEKIIVKPMEQYISQCTYFAERLERLGEFYYAEGCSLNAEGHDYFAEELQTRRCVNLCCNAQAYAWIQMQVNQRINQVNMLRVRHELVESFISQPSVWVSDRVGETRKAFDKIMARCCGLGNGGSLSVAGYFSHILESVPPDQVSERAREVVAGIVARLLEKSKPSLKKRGGSFSAVNTVMLVPQSLMTTAYGNVIEGAFHEELWRWGIDTAGALVVSPSITEIMCYQTSVANALCDLEDISIWEKSYLREHHKSVRHLINGEPGYAGSFCERTKQEVEDAQAKKEKRQRLDLQLTLEEEVIFGTGLSLEHYPPIALHDLENNESEKEFRKTIFDPIMEYAWKEKIIERLPGVSPNSHRYIINLIPDAWTNLNVSAYDIVGSDGRKEKGTPLFLYLQKQNHCENVAFQKEIRLVGSEVLEAEYDFTAALQLGEGRMQKEIDRISMEYMKRKMRKNTSLFLELRETLCRYYEIAKVLG